MTIAFQNGKIISGGHWSGPSPAAGGKLISPSIIVLHYTASGGDTGKGDVDFFNSSKAAASAHFVVGRDGVIYQVVELNRVAWHAGKSSWKGLTNLNAYSIGIEIDNWGMLTKRADGSYRSYTGALVLDRDVVEAKHKNGKTPDRYWEAYPAVQIQAVIDLCKALKVPLPSLTEVVGHDDIAPLRKTDPGPAFPWQHVRSAIEGNKVTVSSQMEVSTNGGSLNVREGAGTNFPKVGSVGNGAKVKEELVQGAWSKITYRTLLGGERTGWVNNSFLKPVH